MAFRKEGSEVVSRVAVPYDFSDIITKQAQTQALFRQNESREKQFELSKQKSQSNFFKVLFQNKKSRHQLSQVTSKCSKFDASQYHNVSHQNATTASGIVGQGTEVTKGPDQPENVLTMLAGSGNMTKSARAAEQKQLVEREMAFLFERGRREEEQAARELKAKIKLGDLEAETAIMKTQRLASKLTDRSNDLADLDFRQFQADLDVPGVQKEVSYMLLDELSKNDYNVNRIGQLSPNDRREVIERCLRCYDKKLFLKLRNGELTIDQVDARLSAKHFGATYKVLDDLRDHLDPDICNGFEDDGYFKKLYNKGLHEEVPLEEILRPREAWLANAHCRRSLIGSAGQRSRKDQSIVRMQQYKRQQEDERRKQQEMEQPVSYDPKRCQTEKTAGRVATRLSRTLSKEQRAFLLGNGEKQEQVENEILQQLTDPELKAPAVRQVISKLKHKVKTQYWPSLGGSKSEGQMKVQAGTSQVQERMQSEQALYKQLMFLKQLDINLDNQVDAGDTRSQIIWNAAHKEMFDRIEAETIRSKRLRLGLERNLQSDAEKEVEMKSRKPRPAEIIEEVKMIGKYGTQPYSKRVLDVNTRKKADEGHSLEEKLVDQEQQAPLKQADAKPTYSPLLKGLSRKLSKNAAESGLIARGKEPRVPDWCDSEEFRRMKEDLNSMNNLSQSFGISQNAIEEYQTARSNAKQKAAADCASGKFGNSPVTKVPVQAHQDGMVPDNAPHQDDGRKKSPDKECTENINGAPSINQTSNQKPFTTLSVTRAAHQGEDQQSNQQIEMNEEEKVMLSNSFADSKQVPQPAVHEVNPKVDEKLNETHYLNPGSTQHGSQLKLEQQQSLYQQESPTKSLHRVQSYENQLDAVVIEQFGKLEQNSVEVVIEQHSKVAESTIPQRPKDEQGVQQQIQTIKGCGRNSGQKQQSNDDHIDAYSSTQSVNNLKSMGTHPQGQAPDTLSLGNQHLKKGSTQLRTSSTGPKLIDQKLVPKVNLVHLEPAAYAVKMTQKAPEIIKIPYQNVNERSSLSNSGTQEDIQPLENQIFGFQKVRSIQDGTGLSRQIPKTKSLYNQTQKLAAGNKLAGGPKAVPPENMRSLDVFKTKIDLNELNEETMSYLYSQDQQLFHQSDLKFIKETLGNLDKGAIMTIASTNPTRKVHQNAQSYKVVQLGPSMPDFQVIQGENGDHQESKEGPDQQQEEQLGRLLCAKSSQPVTENLNPAKSHLQRSQQVLRAPNLHLNPDSGSFTAAEHRSRLDMKSNVSAHDQNRAQISLSQENRRQKSGRRGFSAHPSSRSKADYHIEKLQTIEQPREEPKHQGETTSSRSAKNKPNNAKLGSTRVLKQTSSKRGSNQDIRIYEYQVNQNKLQQQEQKTQSQMLLKNTKAIKLYHNQTAYNWESTRGTRINSREPSTRYSSQLMQLNYRAKLNRFNDGRNNALQPNHSSTQAASTSAANEIGRANFQQKQLNCASSSFIHRESHESLPKSVLQQSQATLNPNLDNRNLRTAAQSILKEQSLVNKAFPNRNQGIGPQRTQAVNLKKQHQRRIQTSNQVKRETLIYRTTAQSSHKLIHREKIGAAPEDLKEECVTGENKSKMTDQPQYVNQGTGHSAREHIIDLSQTNTLQKRLNNINSVSDFMSKFEEQDEPPSKLSNELADGPGVGDRKHSFNKTYQGRRATEQLHRVNQVNIRSSVASGGTLHGRNSSSRGQKTQISSARSRIVSATVQLQQPVKNSDMPADGKDNVSMKQKLQKEHQISRRLVGFLNQNQIPVKLTATEEIRFVKSGRVTSQNRTHRSLRSYRKVAKGKEERKTATSKKDKLPNKGEDGIELSASIGESHSKLSAQVVGLNVLGSHYAKRVDVKNDVYKLENEMDAYYTNENLRIIDNQFISELVNPHLYLTAQTEQRGPQVNSNQQSLIQPELSAQLLPVTSQLHPQLYTTAVQAASAAQLQKAEESSHTIDSQADQYQTYMSAVNARFVDSRSGNYGKTDQANNMEFQNMGDFHEELRVREMQLRLSGLSGNFTRQQHFSDNKRMAAHLSHFRQIENGKLTAQLTHSGQNQTSFSIQHLNTLAVPELTERSNSRNQLKEGTISADQEQADSEVVSKYRATTKLDVDKSNSTRKSIVIKSNRTNRNRIQSAMPRGGSDNLRDDLKHQTPSEPDEGEQGNKQSSHNIFEEIMEEQKRNTHLLSTISKKSEKQQVLNKQASDKGNRDLAFNQLESK